MRVLLINQSPGYLFHDICERFFDGSVEIDALIGVDSTYSDPRISCHYFTSYNRKSILTRLMSWLVFSIQSFRFIIKNKGNFDHIFFTTNPPLIIFLAPLINTKFSVLIYDLYPRIFGLALNLPLDGFIFRLLKKLSYAFYKKSEFVFVISAEMKCAFLSDFPSPCMKQKVTVVPLWHDAKLSLNTVASRQLKFANIGEKFVVLYSGNIGVSHPINALLCAAGLIEDPNIHFFIFSNGLAGQKKIQRGEYRSNVSLYPLQPRSEFSHILKHSKIGIVVLASNYSDLSVPSKTFNLLSHGIPIIAICDEASSLARLITGSNCGIVVPLDNTQKTAEAILSLYSSPELLQRLSKNAFIASKAHTPKNASIFYEKIVRRVKS